MQVKLIKNSQPSRVTYGAMWTGFQITRFACWLRNLVIKPKIADKSILIVVGGGPAPGLPNAIRQAALTALRNGFKVYGSVHGFNGIKASCHVDGKNIRELTYRDIYNLKHSKENILGTSRLSLIGEKNQITLSTIADNIKALRIGAVVAIGGDDTLGSANALYEVGIPVFSLTKTIDDDLLPPQYIDHTFGYDSAAKLAAFEIENLAYDAKATDNKWFFVRIMGRDSGALALSAAHHGGAKACLIPEDYRTHADFNLAALIDDVRRIMEASRASGHNNGVIVISEGLEKSLLVEVKRSGVEIKTDTYGNLLFNLEIHERIANAFPDRNFEGARIETIEIGYGLRTANPTKTDIAITSKEGAAAVKMAMAGKGGYVISHKDGRVLPVSYSNPDLFSNRGYAIRRSVDTHSLWYLRASQEIRERIVWS